MASDTKSISEWEKTKGILLDDVRDVALNKKITSDEFIELFRSRAYTYVDYDARVKFLKDNGHKITRQNLINPALAPKDTEQTDTSEQPE
jgi:hypothetical protein